MENLRASVDMCNAALRGTKKIDVFQSARVDFDRTIEEAIRNMVVLKEEGKFDHLGLSETKAETLRRAHAVRSILRWLGWMADVDVGAPNRCCGDRG